jgi:hypothetical protein
MRSRSLLLWAFAVIAAIAVAACGGSSTVTTVTKTVVNQQTGASGPTTTTNTAATQTNTTISGSACTAADLTPAFLGSNGAAGTIVLGFSLKNTGSSSCHTYGWPGVQFLSSRGSALTTGATRTTTDVAGSTPATAITLKPGEGASFRMTASDVPTGGGGCPTAAKLQIYAPDDTATMTVAVPGIAACGKSTVSPMMPGESAFAGQGGGSGGSNGSGASGSGGSGSSGSGSGGSGNGSGGGQTGLNGSGGSTGSGGASVSG